MLRSALKYFCRIEANLIYRRYSCRSNKIRCKHCFGRNSQIQAVYICRYCKLYHCFFHFIQHISSKSTPHHFKNELALYNLVNSKNIYIIRCNQAQISAYSAQFIINSRYYTQSNPQFPIAGINSSNVQKVFLQLPNFKSLTNISNALIKELITHSAQ